MNLIDAMVAGDKMQINIALRQYKTEYGAIDFPKVLSIDREQRIVELVKKDFPQMITIITAALTLAFEGLNLKRGMTSAQTVDLAEAIIDSSGEDMLAMEDLMLFLQKFVRGEYGAMYESMDIPKFMLSFENYRQERYTALLTIKENKHLELKAMGDGTRSSKKDDLDEHFYSMANQLTSLKSQLKHEKKKNRDEGQRD